MTIGIVDTVLIICGCEESEHNGHVLSVDHPACDKLEIIEVVDSPTDDLPW
jgi:hypothetical protein